MYKISIYGCAMFKKLVCQWVNVMHKRHLFLCCCDQCMVVAVVQSNTHLFVILVGHFH